MNDDFFEQKQIRSSKSVSLERYADRKQPRETPSSEKYSSILCDSNLYSCRIYM